MPAHWGGGGAAPARLFSMPGALRGTPSSTAPYLKQGTDLVLLQVSLDPGLLIRRHRETAGAVQSEGRARLRRGPTLLLPGPGPGPALASLGRPGVAGCSPGAASAWGAESRSPGTQGAANSDNSEARGELIHRARRHGCARRGRGGLRAAAPFSSRRRQQGPERGRRAGSPAPPRAARTGAAGLPRPASVRVRAYPRAGCVRPSLSQVTATHTLASPQPVLALPAAP